MNVITEWQYKYQQNLLENKSSFFKLIRPIILLFKVKN